MEQTTPEPSEEFTGKKDLLRTFFLCLFLVAIVRSFIVEPFKIPSSSMVPTLFIGDHIFVSKFLYGLSLPFTKVQLVDWSEPKRGEVIVFLFPRDESLHYIKRVIAVPGDTLEVKGREITVNGHVIERTAVTDSEVLQSLQANSSPGGEYFEETAGDRHYYVRFGSKGNLATFASLPIKEIVPQDRFFVMGDNRDDSYDSRAWGFVPKENIKGRAEMIWLSLNTSKEFEVSSSSRTVRWKRIGNRVR